MNKEEMLKKVDEVRALLMNEAGYFQCPVKLQGPLMGHVMTVLSWPFPVLDTKILQNIIAFYEEAYAPYHLDYSELFSAFHQARALIEADAHIAEQQGKKQLVLIGETHYTTAGGLIELMIAAYLAQKGTTLLLTEGEWKREVEESETLYNTYDYLIPKLLSYKTQNIDPAHASASPYFHLNLGMETLEERNIAINKAIRTAMESSNDTAPIMGIVGASHLTHILSSPEVNAHADYIITPIDVSLEESSDVSIEQEVLSIKLPPAVEALPREKVLEIYKASLPVVLGEVSDLELSAVMMTEDTKKAYGNSGCYEYLKLAYFEEKLSNMLNMHDVFSGMQLLLEAKPLLTLTSGVNTAISQAPTPETYIVPKMDEHSLEAARKYVSYHWEEQYPDITEETAGEYWVPVSFTPLHFVSNDGSDVTQSSENGLAIRKKEAAGYHIDAPNTGIAYVSLSEAGFQKHMGLGKESNDMLAINVNTNNKPWHFTSMMAMTRNKCLVMQDHYLNKKHLMIGDDQAKFWLDVHHSMHPLDPHLIYQGTLDITSIDASSAIEGRIDSLFENDTCPVYAQLTLCKAVEQTN